MEQKEDRLGFIKTLGIRRSRLRWLGTLQSSDKCGFGSNGYFKKEFFTEFCAVAGRRNIIREMFKFGRTTRKRLLLHSKSFCTEVKRVQVKRSHVSKKVQDSAGWVLMKYEAEKLTFTLWWRIRFLAKWWSNDNDR